MKIKVVHRKFRYRNGGYSLVVQPQYKKAMKLLEKSLAAGKSVLFAHTILSDNDAWIDGEWYDQVELEIS